MLLKHLRGLPVIDPTTARKVGTVLDYQVDPAAGSIAALDISPPQADAGESHSERIFAHHIRRVGAHAIMLTGRGGMAREVADLNERWLDSGALTGLEVLGDDGNRIGHLVGARFDQDSLAIEAYLLRSGWSTQLLRRNDRILPNTVVSCSRDLMLISTGRVAELAAPIEEATQPTPAFSVPLKVEDRLPAPTHEPVADGHTAAAKT
jgi:sporulation protein YlmC with PRC-barrel domain